MEKLVIAGGRPLRGSVRISGAKNACLPIMAAAISTEGTTLLKGAPRLTDVRTLRMILDALGVESERTARGDLRLRVDREDTCRCPDRLAVGMRGSICILGPLLARRGRAEIAMPGGCAIGDRPVDLHLKGLRALGAEIREEGRRLVARADRLRGARVYLGGPRGSTVLGTANVMTAAALAEGTTVIEHAACEPEIQDLATYLNACGARVRGAGTGTIEIEGVPKMVGTAHELVPDRIEAGTFAVATAITCGDLLLENVRTDHVAAVMDAMERMGVRFEARGTALRVWRNGPLRPVDVTALPYPGVPTDLQPQLLALLTAARGTSVVTDSVFPDRFTQVTELKRMGARIARRGRGVVVRGPTRLSAASVAARDLRGGASLIVAALAAEGVTRVAGIEHVDRGYERIDLKLAHAGAQVARVGAPSVPQATPLGRPRRAAS